MNLLYCCAAEKPCVKSIDIGISLVDQLTWHLLSMKVKFITFIYHSLYSSHHSIRLPLLLHHFV